MKRELFYKIIVVVSAVIVLITPFSNKIYASDGVYINAGSLLGYNVSISEYDNEYNINLSSASGTFSGSNGIQTLNPVAYVSNGAFAGQVVYRTSDNQSTSGSINLNLSSSSSNVVFRIIEIEFIFKYNVLGYISYKLPNETSYHDVMVNGNSATIKYLDNINSSSISDYIFNINLTGLHKIDTFERWSFPIESYTTITYMFSQDFEISGIDTYNDYYFPIFKTDSSKNIASVSVTPNNDEWIMIIGVSRVAINNLTRFNQYFTFSNGIEFYDMKTLFVSSSYRIFSIKFKNNSSSNIVNNIKYINNTDNIMPIFINRTNVSNISTDFALVFGLNNSLLDNLNIIANGNSNSNNATSSNDTNNTLLDNTVNDYEDIENNFNNSMNNNLNNIDMTSNLMSNQSFISSANFVKTQFNRLLNNTILGDLIIFILLLGLASLFIGRGKK